MLPQTQTFHKVRKHLTNAQVKALSTTPIEIIAAPGAGKVISIIDFVAKLNYATAAFDNTDTLDVAPTTTPTVYQKRITGLLQSTSTKISKYTSNNNALSTLVVNDGISVKAGGDGSTGGGTLDVYVSYAVITLL